MKAAALYATDFAEAWPAHAESETDYCSREGAQALKAKIEAYWRERGQNVMLSLHNVGFHPAIRAARFDVRSDMVNGMPRATGQRPAGGNKRQIELVVNADEDFDDE